jgi:hypothetical protein
MGQVAMAMDCCMCEVMEARADVVVAMQERNISAAPS